jgi:hypothetical protein
MHQDHTPDGGGHPNTREQRAHVAQVACHMDTHYLRKRPLHIDLGQYGTVPQAAPGLPAPSMATPLLGRPLLLSRHKVNGPGSW